MSMSWNYPNGTASVIEPDDGDVFDWFKKDGSVERYIWDGIAKQWILFQVNSCAPIHYYITSVNVPTQTAKCECGNSDNPMGQGHSHWCEMFKQEMT